MAAEICDGWIPIFFSVDAFEQTWGEHLEAGFAKGGRSRSTSRSRPRCRSAIDGDLEAAKSVVKAGLVLYFGGMGSRKTNFYVDLAHRFGFGDVADEVQRRFQDGDKAAPSRRCPTRSSRRPRWSAPRPRWRSGSSASAAPASTA
jgi:alkanesulfonate monooxygenase SsuD/methylene tetrahydromethanopterin reductase-like flavin-dependent oxidoreductase (luciferase family)